MARQPHRPDSGQKRRQQRILSHLGAVVERSEAERRLLLDAVLLGIVGAFSAQLFIWLLSVAQDLFLVKLAGYLPPTLASEAGAHQQAVISHSRWLIPLATTLGGLLSGILVYSLAPEAEGHGTDTVVVAVHRSFGALRTRVPFVKLIASVITIGSGGSAGREGPTALVSAGIASIYGGLRHRAPRELRLLALMGMASGLSAIFRSPIGTAVFAVEVLYSNMEFEADALLYTMVASVVAFVINGLFVGFGPLFKVPATSPATFGEYGWVALLGIASGVIATFLPSLFYHVRDLFRRMHVPTHIKPALGGLAVGLIAVVVPQVLGGGYGWIQKAIDGRLATELLAGLLVAKMIALSLTVGSGGSGGIFAPSLYVGAMLGGFVGQMLGVHNPMFVVIGMAAVFGGAARIPVATLLMVTEMTGGYHLLVPAALAVMLSFFVQSLLSSGLRYRSMYEGQVLSWRESPAHRQEMVRLALAALARTDGGEERCKEEVDLLTLINSGVGIKLPDGRRLGAIAVPRQWAGISAAAVSRELKGLADVLGVLHGRHVQGASDNVCLNEGDVVLAVASGDDWAAIGVRLQMPRGGADQNQSPEV